MAGAACLAAACGTAQATPLARLDATTTCFSGLEQRYCSLTGSLTGPNGMALPEVLV